MVQSRRRLENLGQVVKAVADYARAFELNPELADDPNTFIRYNAARAAAQAGCGQGKSSADLDDAQRVRLRGQALEWLRADLTACSKLLESSPPETRQTIVQTLSHWQKDTGLAGLRDGGAGQAPPKEQKAFTELWADVAACSSRL